MCVCVCGKIFEVAAATKCCDMTHYQNTATAYRQCVYVCMNVQTGATTNAAYFVDLVYPVHS